MNVLLVNQYYPPDTSATAVILKEIVIALSTVCNPIVIAGRPSYNPEINLTESDFADHARVYRVGSTSYERTFLLGRILNYLSYLVLTLIKGLFLSPRPDVVISMTDPPIAGFVGAVISFFRRASFIYFIQDLHPDLAHAAGLPLPKLLVQIWNYCNIRLLKYCDSIIVIGEDMKDILVTSKGIDPSKIHVVRSGSVEFPIPTTDGTSIIKAIRGNYDFVAIHAGNLGYVGNFKLIIDTFRKLDDRSIGLVFIGKGAMKAELMDYAKNLENIKFLDFYPYNELSHVYSAADLHLISIKMGLEGLVLPSKLYSILRAAKPIFANVPASSDVTKIITENQCGLATDTEDISVMAKQIIELKESDSLNKMSIAAKKASEMFGRATEIRKFTNIVVRHENN
ncbi:MAG: Glycosyltransferase involved in cell wall bisynthesis [Chloroflexi bacterium]|nr:MAG: Glycosyltransferase involved in cell wall bisynthesis [Chloroflexota bacterium]